MLYSSIDINNGGDIMAVVANQSGSKFKLVLIAGVDENNNDIIKSKTFSNVKTTATNDSIYAVASALAGLQSYTLSSIVKTEEYDLLQG